MANILANVNEGVNAVLQEQYDDFLYQVSGIKYEQGVKEGQYKNRDEYYREVGEWFNARGLGVNIEEGMVGDKYVKEISITKLVKTYRYETKLSYELDKGSESFDLEYDDDGMLKNRSELNLIK